jgi:hypothetical protein
MLEECICLAFGKSRFEMDDYKAADPREGELVISSIYFYRDLTAWGNCDYIRHIVS